MTFDAYMLLQIGAAVLAGGVVYATRRNTYYALAVGTLGGYWFLGSLAQEVFGTLTPSAWHFVLATIVFVIMAILTRNAGTRKPFLYVGAFFLGIMFLDVSHYVTVWLSDALPVWNKPYMHLSALLYHLSCFAVWVTAIREWRNEPISVSTR